LKRTNSELCKVWYRRNREKKLAYEARRKPIIAERQAARKRWLYHNDPAYRAKKLAAATEYNRTHHAQLAVARRRRENIDCIVEKMIADTERDPLLEKDQKVRFAYGRTKKRER
jgi:hypothetical protein